MKKIFAMVLAMVCLCGCSAATSSFTSTTTSTTAETTTTTVWTTVTDPQEPENPQLTLFSGAQPEDSVYLLATKTADLQDSIYIPEDQETWKAAWEQAVSGGETTGQPMQWDEVLPLLLCWHQGGTETALYFAPEGSFCFVKDGEVKKTQGESAQALYALAQECYQAFDIAPVAPETLCDAKSAKLAMVHNSTTRYLADEDKLGRVVGILAKAHPINPTACTFDLLTLTAEDGQEMQIALANDGCNIWMSDGAYYLLEEATAGAGTVEEIVAMFGE